jgi:hypothetical protein
MERWSNIILSFPASRINFPVPSKSGGSGFRRKKYSASDHITHFHEDRARAFDQQGCYAIIDRSGRLLTPFMFLPHEGEDFGFHGGLAYVEWEEGNGYINREGKFIWKSE